MLLKGGNGDREVRSIHHLVAYQPRKKLGTDVIEVRSGDGHFGHVRIRRSFAHRCELRPHVFSMDLLDNDSLVALWNYMRASVWAIILRTAPERAKPRARQAVGL